MSNAPTNAQAILLSLQERPHEWRTTTHSLRHVGGLEIWVANGWKNIKSDEGHRCQFSKQDRWSIWQAYETWNRQNIVNVLTVEVKETP